MVVVRVKEGRNRLSNENETECARASGVHIQASQHVIITGCQQNSILLGTTEICWKLVVLGGVICTIYA